LCLRRDDPAGRDEESKMKRISLVLTFLLCAAAILSAESRWAFKGTVIKMQMADCLPGHSFMSNIAGPPALKQRCPEYTVMGGQVVYEVIGRDGEDFMPLAQDAEFAVRRNEIVLFGHNEKVQARFIIKGMMRLADWEHEQQLREIELREQARGVQSTSYGSSNSDNAALAAVMSR
jgi:hypothetical protein